MVKGNLEMALRFVDQKRYSDKDLWRELQPSIAGLVGPMYDGTDANGLPVIRYEDQKSYNTLSA